MKQKLVSILMIAGCLLALAMPVQAVATYMYPSGSLVNDSGTIYFICGTTKIPFTNFQAFTGLGYSLKNVLKGNLSAYTQAKTYNISTPEAAHPWCSWLLYDGAIYYNHETGLVGIPSMATFTQNGGDMKFVVKANKYDLAILAAHNNPPLQVSDTRTYKAVANIAGDWVADTPTQIDPNLILWSPTRKLTWNDFKGPQSSNTLEGAAVSAPISSIANTSHQCDSTTCTFRIDSFNVVAAMDPTTSFVQTGGATVAGLAHEQGHFDIAELEARKLNTDLLPLVGTTVTQATNTADYITVAIKNLLDKKVSADLAAQTNLDLAQIKYDSDTHHSQNAANQAAWLACIASWISSGATLGTCQMPGN